MAQIISMLTIVVYNNDSARDLDFSQMIDYDGVDLIVVHGQDKYEAYNSALDKVRSECVWFVDESFCVEKEILAQIVNRISNSVADFYALDYIVRYDDGRHDVCHSNLYYSSASRLVTMYSREKHVLFLSSMIFRMSIIQDNVLSFCPSAGMYAQKLFTVEFLRLAGKVNHIKDVVVSFCPNVGKEEYCRKPGYTRPRLEQYKVYFDRLCSILDSQDVMFLEDDCFLFKDECTIKGLLPKQRFNSVIPLPYAAIRRNAWSYDSLMKLTIVWLLNKFI